MAIRPAKAEAPLFLTTVQTGPITVVPHRVKATAFRRLSILFRPHIAEIKLIPDKGGGVVGYRPRVQTVYYTCVYHHSADSVPTPKYNSNKNEERQSKVWWTYSTIV